MEASASASGPELAPRSPLTQFRLGDERLARLVTAGHERAFALLYERYHQPLHRYVRSILGRDADAQDVLQSTFASAFAALKAGRRNAPLRPWLFRIAHNEAVSSLRRRRPHAELADTWASPAPSPEEQVIERERLQLLVADLAELSDRQRGALVMRELSGLPHEDIACVLEMSVSSAKQTVFEARRALLELAQGRAMACEEIQRVISDGDKRALRGRKVRAHLRSCSGCAAFAAAIRSRRVDLLALSPTLPAATAAGLFVRVVGAAPGHGGGGAGLAVGLTGKATGIAISAKALTVGVAVLAATTIGAAGVLHQVTSTHHVSRSRIARPIGRRSVSGAPATRPPAGAPARVRPPSGAPGVSGRYAGRVRAGARSVTPPSTAAVGVTGGPSEKVAPSTRASAPGRVVSQSARAQGGAGTRQAIGRSTGSSHGRGSGVGATHAATHGSAGSSHGAANPASTPPAARPVGAPSSRRAGRASPPVPVITNAAGVRTSGALGAVGAASVPPAPAAGARPVQP
jgi:RNA polymerase sigma factor (sigma-70 family)